MNHPKEKPTSGCNHPAGLNTQNTGASLPVLAMLERIAVALERGNEVALMQTEALSGIVTALHHLKEA